MLHLEYYVANLICKFEWRAVDGDDVDLSERTERTNGDEESIACPQVCRVEIGNAISTYNLRGR
jgi:hypothetical protein